MVGPADLVRRLRELISALDRRTPRAVPDDDPGRMPDPPRTPDHTPFPAIPTDVAVLTVQEFTFALDELDRHRVRSMECVCRAFIDDANRALVWWIRFGALQVWCASPEIMGRTSSDARILRDAREVAASFPLNPHWEFDTAAFGRAIDDIARRRARTGVDSAAST